jgi:hypothetical protein
MADSAAPFSNPGQLALDAPQLVSAARSGANIFHTFDQAMNTGSLPSLASLTARIDDELYGATARVWTASQVLRVTYGGLPVPDIGIDASFWTGLGGGVLSAVNIPATAWSEFPVT